MPNVNFTTLDGSEGKDYSEKPRHTWKVAEYEPASLREVDPQDLIDIIRYKSIDRDPEVGKWMSSGSSEDWLTDDDIIGIISDRGGSIYQPDNAKIQKDGRLIYAITGKTKELEGWVQFKNLEQDNINFIEHELRYEFPQGNRILDISYARLHDQVIFSQEKGLISSGVRQVCFALAKSLETTEDNNPNIFSLTPPISVVAYTSPNNLRSRNMLKNVGFKEIGMAPYYEDGEKPNEVDNVWVLDWNSLKDYFAQQDKQYSPNPVE